MGACLYQFDKISVQMKITWGGKEIGIFEGLGRLMGLNMEDDDPSTPFNQK